MTTNFIKNKRKPKTLKQHTTDTYTHTHTKKTIYAVKWKCGKTRAT